MCVEGKEEALDLKRMVRLPRESTSENSYDELEFYFRNSKVYLIFFICQLKASEQIGNT